MSACLSLCVFGCARMGVNERERERVGVRVGGRVRVGALVVRVHLTHKVSSWLTRLTLERPGVFSIKF